MKPKIALIADVPGWAFDVNERDMAKYMSRSFDFEHYYITGWDKPDAWSVDMAFLPYHKWKIRDQMAGMKFFGSLRSRHFTPQYPGEITQEDVDFVNRCSGFHVVTQDNYKELWPHCPHIVYLTNPVDMDRFPKASEVKDPVCCWNGNAGHGQIKDVKGFYGILGPATNNTGIRFNVAEYNTCRKAPDEMPEFYQQSSIALCASMYEGASNSVMEAMASGLAVIATDVGNHSEMSQSMFECYGDSGIMIVDRSVEAFVDAIELLKANPARIKEMGELNRKEIQERWSWEAWAGRYIDAFNDALERDVV
jgi:glycosyltransferase involved in cell wall biosynthesis